MIEPYFLLLLPTPPNPPTAHAINIALTPPLTASLKLLKRQAEVCKSPIVFDIALPCLSTQGFRETTGTQVQYFVKIQNLLSRVYSLLERIYVADAIPQLGSTAIDSRILLLDYDSAISTQASRNNDSLPATVDITALERSRRPWSHILVVECEQGEEMFNQFRSSAAYSTSQRKGPSWKVHRVPGGIQMRLPQYASEDVHPTTQESYHEVATYGSFARPTFTDKLALTMTGFLVEREEEYPQSRIIVGIEGCDSSAAGRETWDARCRAITSFLSGILYFDPPTPRQHREVDYHDGKTRFVELSSKLILTLVNSTSVEQLSASFKSPAAFVVPTNSRYLNKISRAKGWHAVEMFDLAGVDVRQFGQ